MSEVDIKRKQWAYICISVCEVKSSNPGNILVILFNPFGKDYSVETELSFNFRYLNSYMKNEKALKYTKST